MDIWFKQRKGIKNLADPKIEPGSWRFGAEWKNCHFLHFCLGHGLV